MREAAVPEQSAPEREPEDQAEPGLLLASEAARRLGITGRAVRKRIAAGTLKGMMIDGVWHVRLGPEPVAEPARGRPEQEQRNRSRSAPSVPPPASASRSQFDAVMQEWIGPLAARIEILARENGALTADLHHEREQRAEVECERDEARLKANDLAARLAALEAIQAYQEPRDRRDLDNDTAFTHITRPPQRQAWWRILLGLERDEVV